MGCCYAIGFPPSWRRAEYAEETPVLKRRAESIESLSFSTASFVFRVQENLTSRYRVVKKIGEGGFGNVWKVVHKPTGQVRAVKNLSKSSLPREQEAQMLVEVGILKDLVCFMQDHPNILKIYEVIEDATSFHIITELCTGGDLIDRVSATSRFSEAMVAGYMQQILSAVSYCHKRHIVHRDLKPENLLLISEKPDSLLKVIDFGTSSKFSPCKKLNATIGTLYYMAPEVFDEVYNEKCDIWSCGIVMFVLICENYTGGFPPFYGVNDAQIKRSIQEAKLNFSTAEWREVSAEAKKFIGRMLTRDADKRASAQELLLDPWLKLAQKPDAACAVRRNSTLESMRNFRSECKLNHAALQLIAWQFAPPEATEPLKQVFISLDADHDGKLNHSDLEAAFKQLFPNNSEDIDSIMTAMDCDHSGFIEYHEFLAAALNWQQILSPEMLEQAFSVFDTDGNGHIGIEELKRALKGEQDVATPVWSDVMRQVDTDGNGVVTTTQIDIGEFSAMAMRAVQQLPQSNS